MTRIYVPRPLISDAYTISSNAFAGEKAKQLSVYNVVNRRGPSNCGNASVEAIANDDRMVFYGLSDFITQHLTVPVTHYDIDRAAEFMSTAHSFGGSLPFPEELWRRVVNEHHGFLPIEIIALPEGSTFYPGEPYIQVIAKDGFGELAAFIEPIMLGMVSIATARATIARHWLNEVRDEMAYNGYDFTYFRNLPKEQQVEIDGLARFAIHDFGMRASSCVEESALLGRAHLLTFHGTDTFHAAFQAKEMGAQRPTGTSILALAHRIVQGHESEEEAFKAIMEASRQGVPFASYLTDTYNHEAGLNKLAELAVNNPDVTIVARPDSGDYIENVLDIIEKKIPNLRFISGDSITPVRAEATWSMLRDSGHDSTAHGIFGVGGFLRNSANRDIFSSASKLVAKGNDLEPVCKLSEAIGKRSVPGLVRLKRSNPGCPYTVSKADSVEDALNSDYVRYYDSVSTEPTESFDKLQERTINEFDSFHGVDRCNENGVWSPYILAIQQEYEDKYRTVTT